MKLARQPIIPRAHLKPGIADCFAQGRELLESAALLANAGRARAAGDLFVLAAQELGKAVLLREAYDTGHPTPKIASFSDHDVKVTKGATVLGSSAMWLSAPAFQGNAFQANAFQTGLPADEPTRLQALYVNYGSTGWFKAPPIDAETISANVKSALARLANEEKALLE
jgi:AbiV family abortive infection protein